MRRVRHVLLVHRHDAHRRRRRLRLHLGHLHRRVRPLARRRQDPGPRPADLLGKQRQRRQVGARDESVRAVPAARRRGQGQGSLFLPIHWRARWRFPPNAPVRRHLAVPAGFIRAPGQGPAAVRGGADGFSRGAGGRDGHVGRVRGEARHGGCPRADPPAVAHVCRIVEDGEGAPGVLGGPRAGVQERTAGRALIRRCVAKW
mmetsp:Transcript_411/g.1582  ORF Transcript_411/g.1582 Transcript_411/m.1582 type:complete len:202 (-) Transcript_411:147-752(-)